MVTPKVIVTVAPTGGMAKKGMSRHLPTQPEEIAECVRRCVDAGASVAALHARKPDDTATCDGEIYADMNARIRDRCDVIINNSTGGGVDGEMIGELREGLGEILFEQRIRGLDAKPEMATLDGHTVLAHAGGRNIIADTNPDRCTRLAQAFQDKGVKPEWEVFSLAHILQDCKRLIDAGFDKPPYFINIVMNMSVFQGAYPYSPKILQTMVDHLPEQSIFCVSAVGPAQLPATTNAILLGGHVRVGLEDNLYYSRGELATNEQLVERMVRIIRELGAEPASAEEARVMLNLPPVGQL